MTARLFSSSLMNLTPMPAGRSSASASSRFQTTRPTPARTASSSAIRISNFSKVPDGNGEVVLMKIPPRLTFSEWCSTKSSTVALL